MIDGYELFRPTEEQILSTYSAAVESITSGENLQPLDLGPVKSSVLEALQGKYADLSYDYSQPPYEIELEGGKKGYILMDRGGVITDRDNEVLVPALNNCTCFIAELEGSNLRMVFHSNYLYYHQVFAQALQNKRSIRCIFFGERRY
ncbi:MAG: hypothetical protein UU80_C0033G0005 [candidate division WWE3 bacterium GW2011_GWA1_41_8]|uniref:Uncharacterized protein n=1 Tax=candidate division WWE3 bacterium GW2011_GWA1_41_8 TaxID=1619103 RepID=A0A0G0X828_UNCKA|nr:MAG: hypothetical protein UU80_C0033G0005 [candidate division WWE3 bacterium GW2011_GWA1_41_8]